LARKEGKRGGKSCARNHEKCVYGSDIQLPKGGKEGGRRGEEREEKNWRRTEYRKRCPERKERKEGIPSFRHSAPALVRLRSFEWKREGAGRGEKGGGKRRLALSLILRRGGKKNGHDFISLFLPRGFTQRAACPTEGEKGEKKRLKKKACESFCA